MHCFWYVLCWHTAWHVEQVGHTFMPAFSARARTTDSKASANLRMAYCSKPAHVYRKDGI